MDLSVVIATKGRPDVLADTFDSLVACEPPPGELVVVDGDESGSAEPVLRAYAERDERVNARHLRSRPGLPLQRNVGVEETSGDAVVFLDDDVEVDPRLFGVLAGAYAEPGVVGATGQVIEPEGRRFGNKRSLVRRLLVRGGKEGTMTRFGYPRRLQDTDRARDVEFMQGCLMSARRTALERVRFDEKLAGYALAEDEDFSYRLSRLGRIRYLPDAVLVHKNTGFRSTGTREFNRMVAINRTYLFRKNFRRTALARIEFAALMLLLAGHRAVNREWMGVRGLAEGSLEAWRRRQ